MEALARALQLDDAERAHLFDLARAAGTPARPRRRPAQQQIRPTVQRILDAMTDVPAYVRNGRRDILGANRLGHALYSEPYADASDLVANLRTEAGRNAYDRALSDLVGELSMRSEEFRTRWAAHNVRCHNSGLKAIHHPVVGEIHLAFESMDLPAGPGLSLIVYSAGPGSAAEESLKLLASWSATTDGEAAASTAGEAPALPAQVLRAATNRADGATP